MLPELSKNGLVGVSDNRRYALPITNEPNLIYVFERMLC